MGLCIMVILSSLHDKNHCYCLIVAYTNSYGIRKVPVLVLNESIQTTEEIFLEQIIKYTL